MFEEFETVVFNKDCAYWTKSKESNKSFILLTERFLNDRLRYVGWVSLNNAYAYLGFPEILEAQRIGWKISDCIDENNCVKFEVEDYTHFDDDSNLVINFKNLTKIV